MDSIYDRGGDGCTFGADLRVCGFWVRSRSFAANHAGVPCYILLPAEPDWPPGVHAAGKIATGQGFINMWIQITHVASTADTQIRERV